MRRKKSRDTRPHLRLNREWGFIFRSIKTCGIHTYCVVTSEIIQILHPYKKELPRVRARISVRCWKHSSVNMLPRVRARISPLLVLKKSFDTATRNRTNAPKPWYYWACKKERKNFYQFLYLFWPKKQKSKLKTAFLDFGTLYIKNPKVTQSYPSLACACVVINSLCTEPKTRLISRARA